MSYLLFIDESGHDHKQMPYEVRGGIALPSAQLWSFVREMAALEQDCFGVRLHRFQKELKGYKLLDKDRFRWSQQLPLLDPLTRRQNALAYLERGRQKEAPTRLEFTAYGQACLAMAVGIMDLLFRHQARIFACAIPAEVTPRDGNASDEFLRKDQVFLLERYFYLLDTEQQTGLLVMDMSEQQYDRRFVQQLERYFTRTTAGQTRARWIVPYPFFVSSEMTYPIQAADVCIYCINWGFRRDREMVAPVREEISELFEERLARLQWQGTITREGETFPCYGIVYVPDPNRGRQKKEVKP